MSPLYLVFHFSTKSLSNYLEIYFKSSKWHKFMYMNGNSGARSDRFAIKDNDFFKMEIKIPHDEEERNKIYKLNTLLHRLLTLYERKIKLVNLLNKELENRIYNNDLLKEIVLSNVKLKEILKEKSDKSTYENQYPMLSSTNSGIELRNGRTNSSSNIGYKILSKNELVLSPQNLWLGNININFDFENGLVSPSYKIFKLEKNINPIFINSLLHHPKMMYLYKVVSVQEASVVRRNLDIEAFENLILQLPTIEAQNKLGSLIKTTHPNQKHITKHNVHLTFQPPHNKVGFCQKFIMEGFSYAKKNKITILT